ncbi:MAG: hypothetical protein A3F09_03750 [Chlamydiae bacterium RIFCSPHIGHO2_12_FULL_49_11]|nr:MAG: hypothetical protein A3F09_03750 [Chlamydiae bacterium RIFCSPHIGHO2_12_FULL_49_11]
MEGTLNQFFNSHGYNYYVQKRLTNSLATWFCGKTLTWEKVQRVVTFRICEFFFDQGGHSLQMQKIETGYITKNMEDIIQENLHEWVVSAAAASSSTE